MENVILDNVLLKWLKWLMIKYPGFKHDLREFEKTIVLHGNITTMLLE